MQLTYLICFGSSAHNYKREDGLGLGAGSGTTLFITMMYTEFLTLVMYNMHIDHQ